MESLSFTPLLHVPGCSKCSQPCKSHPLPYGTNCALALAKEHADKSRDIPAWGMEGPGSSPLAGPIFPGWALCSRQCSSSASRTASKAPWPEQLISSQWHSSPLWLPSPLEDHQIVPWQCCPLGLASKISSQPETDTKLTSSHSNSVTLLLSSPTAARSWTTSWIAIPLWPHWQNFQQHQAPVQPAALPLWDKCHLSCSKALPQARPIPQPAVSTSMGRQLHPATKDSHNPNRGIQDQAFSFQGQTHNNTWNHSALPFLLSEPLLQFVCSHPRPAFSPKPAAPPPSLSCHGSAQGHPAQHHGWHLLQQSRISHPPGHGVYAIWFTDSNQGTQHSNGHSYHGQGDSQCASETTAENYTGWVYKPFWASPSRCLV